jgi:hypothetical protein
MHIASLVVVLLLLAGAKAIPAAELDYSEPELFNKILNGSVVIDMPEEKKRGFPGVIAGLWSDINVPGYPTWQLTYTAPGISVIPTGSIGVSSVQLFDLDYVLVCYNQPNFGASADKRIFRTPQPINKMGDQDNFNDKCASAQAVYLGPTFYGVNLWEGSNYSNRVSYVYPGLYPTLTNSGCNPNPGNSGTSACPSIRSDTLSSFEVMPNVALFLFKDTNYGGNTAGPFPYGYYVPQVSTSTIGFAQDSASSVQVYSN